MVAIRRSTAPDWRAVNRVAVVTGTSWARLSSSNRTRPRNRARSISKPTGRPCLSREPNGGASVLTPMRMSPRVRMASSEDSAWAHVPTARTSPRPAQIRGHLEPIRLLLAEMRQRGAQRSAGNVDEPLEWLVQLEDQIDRTRDGERADEERRDDGHIARRKEAEAGEEDGDPEGQDHQERKGNGAPSLRNEQRARAAQIDDDLARVGSKRALSVVLRRERLDPLVQGFRTRPCQIQFGG